MTTVSAATVSPDSCDLRAGAAVDRGLGQAAVDDHAGGEPGAEVGGAEPDQLAVGVDVVAGLGRVRLRRAEPLGEADQQHADRRPDELQVVVRRGDVRQAEGGSPASMCPTIATPLRVEVEQRDRGDAQQHRHQRARTSGSQRRSRARRPG